MGNGQPVQAVVFDLDDTLYSERQYVRGGYAAVGEALRARLGRGDAFESWLWDRFCRGRSAGAFDAMNERFSLGLGPEQITELVVVYRGHRPQIAPRDGAVEMLARLAPRVRLGLLTDGFLPAQRLKLDALGIERFFHAVVFTEAMGRECWKPSPAGFEAIRAKLDVPHEACAYVGDNPSKDFLAPNRLGWRTVRLACQDQVHGNLPAPPGGEPAITIGRLDDLDAVLSPLQ
jgi:putative hydrolase of the HAD superfamily